MFKPNSVIVYVKDVDTSTEFYTKILGRPPINTYPGFAVFLLKDNFILGLQEPDKITPKAPNHYGGFELSFNDVTKNDVDEIYSTWKKLNVRNELEPQMLDFGYTFVGNDPDGHRLRVCATDTSKFE
ncbi:VOC family protein [Snodgrassella alvi]|uniref:Phenazine biosynthesis protein n=1 Tax=Snodgrassella alvi TaxID=1196083 RepID=A0A2N9X988_9NEIS|nr:VOC family protein [Snodgrassella alvi]PIT41410.1 phenazine biosynthesis protein [Snodgrassella alvi]